MRNLVIVASLLIGLNSIFILGTLAQAARPIDSRVVSVQELSDVETSDWSYAAVKGLVEKYDVLEGYPDGTYKGKKLTTRFELAAAVYDLATYFSDEIGKDRDDLSKLAKLMDEFSSELKTLQGRVDKLEARVTDIDGRVTTLEGTVAKHETLLQEHEKRLAYAERRKGFILERLIKGLVVDVRDLSRGVLAAVTAPFNKDLGNAINK
jgi:uncharacterized coiled-coil protein SlyX